jgi:RNA-directed DNA polymerase
MKRIGNLYSKICSLENLYRADQKARKGKGCQPGVREHIGNWQANLYSLYGRLAGQTYRTSPYITFKIYEPKEREIYRLPYFPDRITHHAVMNILEPIFVASFTADTYSCIKGKGIHGAANAVKRALRDQAGTTYCLKLDIRKFYPSISHNVLKGLLRRKFKDEQLLWLLEEIIDSAPGLPIGNYLSQYFANLYLTGFDHWLKEVKGVRHYFRYADDLVILGPNKAALHQLLADIRGYLKEKLRLDVKGNYQVFPVAARGIDFVGYVFYHTHTRLRPSIKKAFARMMARRPRLPSFASYNGWAFHCDSRHLLKTLLQSEKFQRIQHLADAEIVRGRQDQDRQDPEQKNNRSRFPDRRFQIRKGQQERQMPLPADLPGGKPSCPVLGIDQLDGDDRTGAQGRLSFFNDNRETK